MLSLSGVDNINNNRNKNVIPQLGPASAEMQVTMPTKHSARYFFLLFFFRRCIWCILFFFHCSVFDRTTNLNAIFRILYLSVSQLSSTTKLSVLWLPRLIIASQAQDDINNFFAKIFGENLKCSLMFIFSSRVEVLLMFILVPQVESVRSRAWSLTWTSVSPPSPSVTPARLILLLMIQCWWYKPGCDISQVKATWDTQCCTNLWYQLMILCWWYFVDDTLLMILCW